MENHGCNDMYLHVASSNLTSVIRWGPWYRETLYVIISGYDLFAPEPIKMLYSINLKSVYNISSGRKQEL